MSSCQDHKYIFHSDTFALEHTMKNYTYIGLKIKLFEFWRPLQPKFHYLHHRYANKDDFRDKLAV